MCHRHRWPDLQDRNPHRPDRPPLRVSSEALESFGIRVPSRRIGEYRIHHLWRSTSLGTRALRGFVRVSPRRGNNTVARPSLSRFDLGQYHRREKIRPKPARDGRALCLYVGMAAADAHNWPWTAANFAEAANLDERTAEARDSVAAGAGPESNCLQSYAFGLRVPSSARSERFTL